MELQAEAGDIGAAIGTYHRCATVLEQELAVAPGAGISKLVQQLLGRSAAPDRHLASGRYRWWGVPAPTTAAPTFPGNPSSQQWAEWCGWP
jgi:DNA-binding SARP family transcriptional activator